MNIIEKLTTERDERIKTITGSKSIGDLLDVAEVIQSRCTDFKVDSRDTWLDPDLQFNHLKNMHRGFQEITSETEGFNFDFTQYSFSQLCTKFGVPVNYMKNCLKKGQKGLVQENINTWLQNTKTKKDLLVRSYDDKVRGVLSDKYSIMDAPTILENVAYATTGNFDLKSYMLNEERLHVRMISDKLNVPNEDLFTGIQIDSSDVGRNTLEVKFFVYKQVCTNGLVVPVSGSTLYSQRHIGITPDEFKREFKKNLDLVPQVAAEVGALITSSIDSKISYKNDYFQHQVEKIITDLKLPKELDNKIIELIPKYGKNKWGIVNALTEIAQDYTLERRLEIERYAGKLLVA